VVGGAAQLHVIHFWNCDRVQMGMAFDPQVAVVRSMLSM